MKLKQRFLVMMLVFALALVAMHVLLTEMERKQVSVIVGGRRLLDTLDSENSASRAATSLRHILQLVHKLNSTSESNESRTSVEPDEENAVLLPPGYRSFDPDSFVNDVIKTLVKKSNNNSTLPELLTFALTLEKSVINASLVNRSESSAALLWKAVSSHHETLIPGDKSTTPSSQSLREQDMSYELPVAALERLRKVVSKMQETRRPARGSGATLNIHMPEPGQRR